MSYLHCHNCGWEQDDFWSSDGYHPFRQDWIDHLTKILFTDTINTADESGRTGQVESTKYVAYELRRMADRIEKMNVKTYEAWTRVKGSWVCPSCGQRKWDID